MMTRKHFRAVAEILRRFRAEWAAIVGGPVETNKMTEWLEREFAEWFRDDNPRFSGVRFGNAVWKEESHDR